MFESPLTSVALVVIVVVVVVCGWSIHVFVLFTGIMDEAPNALGANSAPMRALQAANRLHTRAKHHQYFGEKATSRHNDR